MPITSQATKSEAELARLEAQIRASVQCEDFTGTEKLFEQYRSAIEQCVRTASHPLSMCQSLSGRVQDLFEWARRMTLLSRSKYQTQLSALYDARQYLAAQTARVVEPTFRVRG